jgi:surface protein
MKDKKILFGTFISLLVLLTTGLSYAYFSTSVSGNNDAKDVVVETGTLKLVYTDSPEIVAENIKPGWTTTKVVTVKNTGTLDVSYNLVWQELTNEITNNELVISASCERLNNSNAVEGTCESITESSVGNNKIKKNISIESGITHKYTFTITFKEMNQGQDYNQNKKFNGVIGAEEYKKLTPTPIYCTFDGELTQGAEYVNGKYTYRYMQEQDYGWDAYTHQDILSWVNITEEGWGVQAKNSNHNEPITSQLCTYINDKPVISYSYMFTNVYAPYVDLSSFYTSNVTNMYGMFNYGNIQEMDLSGFDTSNVTNMSGMFSSNEATTLDLSNFNTSKVTNMSNMFKSSQATAIKGLENFDTSNIIDMNNMFNYSKAISLNLSNFNTSNVTNMSWMFYGSQATSLDLSSFNTSNVTNMNRMFSGIKIATLDLSSFDTSNVTDMSYMFSSGLENTIIVSNKFNVDAVTSSNGMFNVCTNLVGGNGTTYDSTKVDKTYARIDTASTPGYFTAK